MTVADTAANARAYFDSRAQSWEEERQDYFTDAVRNEIIARGDFAGEDRVVDYGAGSGYLTEALLGAGVNRIVAIDVSPNMLLELQARFGPAIETRVAEDWRIPLETASADKVISNMVLHHLEEPGRFFGECARVLRPRGQVIVTDLMLYGATGFARDQHDRWAGFDLDQIRHWITAAGLLATHVGPIGQRCCAAVPEANGGAEIFIAHATRSDVS